MSKFSKFSRQRLLIVSGSTQAEGQSLKVANYIGAYLKAQKIDNSVLDLHVSNLPFFGWHQQDPAWSETWSEISGSLKRADGIVLVSPEYNGGPSPAILNLMLYVNDELQHKPVLLVGVSAGRGGAYPTAALRQSGPKDPRYVVLPDNLIISRVQDVLNDHDFEKEDLTPADREVRQSVSRNLLTLLNYARALGQMDSISEN